MLKLNHQEKKLIAILGFYAFANSLAAVFTTAFLFKISSLKTTILFNLILFSSLLFWYLISGWTFKKISSVLIMKISLFAGAFFYFLMFILKEKSSQYIIPLGLISGFSFGNFWAGFNLNQYLLTQKGKRIKYFASLSGLNNFLNILAPLLGGAIIHFSRPYLSINAAYGLLFFFACLILVSSSFIIHKLPQHPKIIFSFKSLLKHQQSKKWQLILLQQTVSGLYDVSLGTIIIILAFLIVKKELWLGLFQAGNFIFLGLGSLLAMRFLKEKSRRWWLGSWGMALGLLLFAFWQNIFGLISFIILAGFTAPFLNTWINTICLNAIDKEEKQKAAKYYLLMMEKELFLGISRILSFLFLYFLAQSGRQIYFAQKSLFVFAAFPLILGLLIKKYEEK